MTSKAMTTGLQSFNFDTLYNEEARHAEYKRLLNKYGDRSFVIIEPKTGRHPFDIKQTKFLVGKNATFGELLVGVRKQVTKLSHAEALYLIIYKYTPQGIQPVMPAVTDLVSTIYQECKYPDGFMRVVLAKEETYGSP